MHGDHVLCITRCVPAAQRLQQGPPSGLVPASKSQGSGGRSPGKACIASHQLFAEFKVLRPHLLTLSAVCFMPMVYSGSNLKSHVLQERACQLTAALTVDKSACTSLVPESLKALLELCNDPVAAAVQEQACNALCRLARPSAGCHACSHLQALGAPLILLQSLQGAYPCTLPVMLQVQKRCADFGLTQKETN